MPGQKYPAFAGINLAPTDLFLRILFCLGTKPFLPLLDLSQYPKYILLLCPLRMEQMQQSSSSFPSAAAWWRLPPPTSCEHRELINTKKTEVIDTRRPIKRLGRPIIRLQVASGSASLNKERLGRPGARTGGERGVQGAAAGQRRNRLKKPCTEARTAAEERNRW